MSKNTLLKELWTPWIEANRGTLAAKIKKDYPEVKKISDLEVMGYETYAVLQTKEDREPVAVLKIDYSEPVLIISYV